MVHYMTSDDIMRVHHALVRAFADTPDPIAPSGARLGGLVESASGRPKTSLGNREKYPTLELKAASLLHSLITSHPFHNGNKRTGLVSTLAFLEGNGQRFDAQDDELFDFTLAVANKSGAFADPADDAVAAIAQWLEFHLVRDRGRLGEMKLQEFLSSCESAGCTVRNTKDGSGDSRSEWQEHSHRRQYAPPRRQCSEELHGQAWPVRATVRHPP